MLTAFGIAAVAWIAGASLLAGLLFRGTLIGLWREPMLRDPVLIIESDDWGPGPEEDAEALRRIAAVLEGACDKDGRHPVMTLGIVLAVADTASMRREDARNFYRQLLSDDRFAAIRDTIGAGIGAGVFAPQLHGMEHYWPPTLLSAARLDGRVRDWLTQAGWPRTEDLPSALQSRWVDAAALPSKPLPDAAIASAVIEEVRAYEQAFGSPPEVAVPPTFVWDDAVERAWAAAGVRVVVTPGKRFEARDGNGKLTASGAPILNGQKGAQGLTYLVRDDYFEPALGHKSEKVIAAVAWKSRLGRPTLVETHRFNFTGDAKITESSIAELERVLKDVLSRFPDVRFMSTAELARHMGAGSPELMESRLAHRLEIWLARIREAPNFWRLAKLTGAALPFRLLALVLRSTAGCDLRGAREICKVRRLG
ncbi:MAG: hypothetical protein AB1710_08375 [Pseudomonadota bacterium]